MVEYTLQDVTSAFKTGVAPLLKEVMRARIKRATPNTEMPGEGELARLNPPPVVPRLSKKAQEVKDLLDAQGKKGGPVPLVFYQAFGSILEEEIPRGEAPKAQEHPWFGEVVHMVVEEDTDGGKDTVYPPFTMVVPLANPNRHVYPLNKPCMVLGGLQALTFQPGEKGDAGEIMQGNDLPSASLDPRSIRYATEEEIDGFLDKVFNTVEGCQIMLGFLNSKEKEELKKAKAAEA